MYLILNQFRFKQLFKSLTFSNSDKSEHEHTCSKHMHMTIITTTVYLCPRLSILCCAEWYWGVMDATVKQYEKYEMTVLIKITDNMSLFQKLHFLINKPTGYSRLSDLPAWHGRSVDEGFVFSLTSNKTGLKHYTGIPSTYV